MSGFLPHSIRLSFLDHHFDLAMTCQQEKDVWATALCSARDNAVVLPFDLPCSIFTRPARSRRDSVVLLSDHAATPVVKRNSLMSFDPVASSPMTPLTRTPAQGTHADLPGDASIPASPTTPMTPMTPMTPLRRQSALSSGTPQTILLRRASPWHRTVIDEHLVFSEEISLARMCAESRSVVPPSPKPASGGSLVRSRMSIRDSSVLKRRRSYIELQGFGGHARTDSTASPSMKDDYRSLRTPTSTKRASLAGSIKRGLSMSLHDDHAQTWHTPAMATTSLLSSPEISAAPITVPLSPQCLTDGKLHEEPQHENTASLAPSERQAQRHARSQSQGIPYKNPLETPQRTVTGSLPRKQSLTRLGSFFGKVKTDGSHSLPSSPSVNVIPRDSTRTGQNTPLDPLDPNASGYFQSRHQTDPPIYSSGAGLTNIRPEMPSQPSFLTRSMSFAKLKGKTGPTTGGTSESTGGWDSRRSSVDADGLLSSSVYSTPSEPPHGLQSVPGSPSEPAGRSLDEAVGTTTSLDTQAGLPRSRAPSDAGTEGSGRSTSDSYDRRPGFAEDKLPKRRRSVRFLSSIKIKGLTSITGHTSQA